MLFAIASRCSACCWRTQLVSLALPVLTQCAGCLFLYFSNSMLRVLDTTDIRVTNLMWVLGTCRRSLLAAVVWSAWRHLACCARLSKLATMATGQTTGGSCTTAADSWAALQALPVLQEHKQSHHRNCNSRPLTNLYIVKFQYACLPDLAQLLMWDYLIERYGVVMRITSWASTHASD